ncbi:MAG: aldehyde dehydrogenase family protein [Candidatus Krumholzibacteria bacterium]|nr:aldehyde dehydrogenase family protein [Candidatus Krumholzibacteria bacterium]
MQDIISPYDGSVVGRVCVGGGQEVLDAIAAARGAFAVTKDYSSGERSELCAGIAAGIAAKKEAFAGTIALEAGKPLSQARREVDRAVATFTIAAEEAKRIGGEGVPIDLDPATKGYAAFVGRFPIGPVAAISPFNFPLNLVAHKVAPALACGCTVVHKPASRTPLTAVMLAETIDDAGAPPGAYNLAICGKPAAELLATDPRLAMLTFTGSAGVGWRLKEIAGRKKVALELGGNAGVFVGADADLPWAAKRCAQGAYAYAGQICISVQRIYADRAVFDEFVRLFLEEASKLRAGDPMDENTFLGPLIDEESADRVMKWVEEAVRGGAKLLLGGGRRGNVIDPILLTGVDPKAKVSAEEVFGPVAIVEPCDGPGDGIARIDDSRYGLQAAVFTNDIRTIREACRAIEVGGLIVNDYPTFRADNYPYGGVKESGSGREGVRYAIEEMTEPRTLVINFNPGL